MRAVFLDRDGVINENRPDHVTSWETFRFLPGALRALQLLAHAEFQVFVITNQAIINRQLIDHTGLATIHRRMRQTILAHGGRIRELRYCPHLPGERCTCRKPEPGMIVGLGHDYGIDLTNAYLVGDALSDLAAGQAAGCRTIIVRTGRGAEQLAALPPGAQPPDHVADDLLAAVLWMLSREGFEPSPYAHAAA